MRFLWVSLLLLLFTVAANAQLLAPEHFPVDAPMRARVDFWKKVYTEINSFEAFLHDSEDLTIIYKKISYLGLSQRQRNRLAENEKRAIAETLRQIVRRKREGLNEEEARLFEMVKTKTDAEILQMARDVRKQQGLKDRYFEGLVRAYPYLEKMKQIFDKEKLPGALVFLPHVESSFNYRAYSKVGAAGMWQFMRSAARTYGLKMNYLSDERRDPLLSTRAAARFLRDNYAKLQAWPLAITAYNHGPKSIERAVATLGTREISHIIGRYRNRRFGFASKNFYATFVATAEISVEPEKYFPNYPKNEIPELSEVNLKQRMTMEQIARATGISKEALQDYNLALRPAVFRSNFYLPKNFSIRIPVVSEARLQELQEKFAGIAKETPAQAQATEEREHVVARGENLYTIAKTYDIEVAELIYRNTIAQPSQIRAGMRLKIPPPGRREAPVVQVAAAPLPANPEQVAKTTEPSPVDEFTNKEAEIAEPVIAATEKATEASGGFFSRITNAFREKAKEPLPIPTISDRDTPSPATTAARDKSQDFDPSVYNFDMVRVDKNNQRIVVEVDETLGHYAEWARTSPATLRRLNRLNANMGIRQGQKLILPLDDNSAMQFHLNRIRFHQAIEEDLYGNYKVTGEASYQIARGDTIGRICRKLDIPFWLLRKFYPQISQQRLAVGEIIKVPQLSPIREDQELPAQSDGDEDEA